ncbi:MAG: hypothetical protein KatS3mg110_0328 [Pirellulaceae bacterium]|nr:MAG: hypothetical protein KatS3mg110_0328 [Pirellulaceae bacterium]
MASEGGGRTLARSAAWWRTGTPDEKFLARVGRKISDGRILGLIKMFRERGVMEGVPTCTPEEGPPRSDHQPIAIEHLSGRTRPSDVAQQKSLRKFYGTIRPKTRRTDGRPLTEILADVNRTLRGWCEYHKHSTKTIFPEIDQWVRMRLRSILRRRRKGKGRGRGRHHHRWPDAFFGAHELFDLMTAHRELWQPSRRHPRTAESYAGDPHVRFGGKRGPNQWAFPTPIFE